MPQIGCYLDDTHQVRSQHFLHDLRNWYLKFKSVPSFSVTLLNLYTPSKGVILNSELFTKEYDILFDYEGNKKIESKAITHYEVIDSNKNYSLIKLNPITGRKHQLRKQLLLHGHPILGDSKYRISKKNFNKKNFLMLHAHKISFAIDKKRYIFTAEAPDNFKKVIMEKYLKIF